MKLWKWNIDRLIYSSSWFIIGFFTLMIVDDLIEGNYGRTITSTILIALNLYNQSGLWNNYGR